MKTINIEKTQDAAILALLNEDIQSLHTRLYPSVFKPYNKEAIEKAFQEMLNLENCIAFLAKQEDKSIGYLLCFIDHKPQNAFMYESNDLYIDQIFVKEEYRKQGVAQKLIAEVKNFAKNIGMVRLHLDYWRYNNDAQIAFEKMGFENFRNQLEMYVR